MSVRSVWVCLKEKSLIGQKTGWIFGSLSTSGHLSGSPELSGSSDTLYEPHSRCDSTNCPGSCTPNLLLVLTEALRFNGALVTQDVSLVTVAAPASLLSHHETSSFSVGAASALTTANGEEVFEGPAVAVAFRCCFFFFPPPLE